MRELIPSLSCLKRIINEGWPYCALEIVDKIVIVGLDKLFFGASIIVLCHSLADQICINVN